MKLHKDESTGPCKALKTNLNKKHILPDRRLKIVPLRAAGAARRPSPEPQSDRRTFVKRARDNLLQPTPNLVVMAFNLIMTASNLLAMASNLHVFLCNSNFFLSKQKIVARTIHPTPHGCSPGCVQGVRTSPSSVSNRGGHGQAA